MVRNQSLDELDKHTELSKIRINDDHLPPFRPIIDKINTVHYIGTKYLTNLFFCLTENNFTILALILIKLKLNPVKYLMKVTYSLALTAHRHLLAFL